MELDKVTRVYGISNTSQGEVAIVLGPAYQAGGKTYHGAEAQAIFNRADFRLIPYTTGQEQKEVYGVYRAPYTTDSDRFIIDTTQWPVARDSAQGYQRIPQEVQIRANEKQPTRGLTILVLKR